MSLEIPVPKYPEPVHDFRGVCWGMSKEWVIYSEGHEPFNEGDGYVTYLERVMGLDAVLGYHFSNGALVEAGYAFRGPLGDERVYIREYAKVKGILTCSYGRPTIDEDACLKCSGDCVDVGNVESLNQCPIVYLSEWTTERSVIRLLLMGEGEGFDFGLLHRSKPHEMAVSCREHMDIK